MLCSPARKSVVRGLDHTPPAVKGFGAIEGRLPGSSASPLSPGRPHVKFPDGTEIELITAPAAAYALSSEYHHWRQGGDDPAFLGLDAPDFGALVQRLSWIGLSLDRKGGLGTLSEVTILCPSSASPTDRPEHVARTNTALSLVGVLLAGAVAEQRLLPMLGSVPLEESACGPFDSGSTAFSLSEGVVVFLPATAQLAPDRTIVGATVTVKRLRRQEAS